MQSFIASPFASAARKGAAALALWLLAAGVLLGAAPGTGMAAAGPAQAQARSEVTFGVKPASATAPDARDYFSLGATPGGALTDRVAVTNYSTGPLQLTLHATDAANTAQGDLALLAPNAPSSGVGRWVSFPAGAAVRVPARGMVIVPFELRVPANASPGDHFGGIIVTLESAVSGPSGQRVRLLQSVGTRLLLRVSGPAMPQLEIDHLRVHYQGTINPVASGRAVLRYRIRNTGNLALGGRQTVWISGIFGSSIHARSVRSVPLLLPGGSVEEAVTFPQVYPRLKMVAHVVISPLSVPGASVPPNGPYRATVRFWAVPSWLVGAPALLLAGVAAWYLRRRLGRPPAPRPPGAPPLPLSPLATPDPLPVPAPPVHPLSE